MPLDPDNEYLVVKRLASQTARECVSHLDDFDAEQLKHILVPALKRGEQVGQIEETPDGDVEMVAVVLAGVPLLATLIHTDKPSPRGDKKLAFVHNLRRR
jgi:regulator of RNase E activity RraB